MAKKEIKTDLWVYELLKQAGIFLDPQGSSIKEIDDALKTASKKGTGKVGFPEYVGVVKDFILVIEDKADISKHEKDTEDNAISLETADVVEYAVNGALFYAKHLVRNTSYEKALAFGVSGNEKRHKITPIYVEDTEPYTRLPDVESFISFNESNITEYYEREILHEDNTEKSISEVLKDAKTLNEDLRVYGSLGDREKPIVVSGILLALDEVSTETFSITTLTGDTVKTDGEKIYDAIVAKLDRDPIKPQKKKDKILRQFAIIKTSTILNDRNETLKKTPLRHYAEFLDRKIYKSIKYTTTSEDYLGRFYSEFMSYSGGDGQSLGIVLTPKHITELFCDLLAIKSDDVVFDPCCGTAGFLIAAMHHMLSQAKTDAERKSIKKNQLHGIEVEDYMFTIATTNMILREDGKSNLENEDFLKQSAGELQRKGATVGMMNPPYSMAKKKKDAHLYEICFTEHLLDSLSKGARCAVIVPQSSMTGKSAEEQSVKANILKHHTLEGVISLNKDTFYSVGVIPCIAVFTAGEPHTPDKECKFINFENDGFKVSPHIGLVETESAKDKKQHLLDVWFDRISAETKYCVVTTVEAKDEWLHSFYYFNDTIPSEDEFSKTIGDYLTFEFSMIMQGRQYLFTETKNLQHRDVPPLETKTWKDFFLKKLFPSIQRGRRLVKEHQITGNMPYVSSTALNNGIDNFICNSVGVRKFSNCLSIANSGSVGSSFYEPFTYVASDHVTHLKNDRMNMYHYLFIATLTRRMSEKYNFNREINDFRISKEKIILPVSASGEIDYDYMEQYIKNLMLRKYKDYATYRERK